MSKLASPRGKGKRKDPNVVGKLRVHELNRLFAYRFRGTREGWQFPDDDAGLECLKILIQHYCRVFPEKMSAVFKARAPWADADEILEEVVGNPRAWRAPALGRELNLSGAEWRKFRFRTIAPVDMTLEERRYYSRIISEGKRRQKRRLDGMATREEYLAAHSLSRDKPWEAEDISRKTWERRRNKARNQVDASLAAIKLTTVAATPASEKGLVLRPPLTPAPPDLYLRLYALGLLDDVPDLARAA